MILKAKGIGHGLAEGEVLVSRKPLSFLGGVDPNNGIVLDESSDLFKKNIAGKILAFPHGKGSTVGSYVIFQLLKSGKAPAAIINEKAETIVATGAILAEIPMLSGVPMEIFSDGDHVIVNADAGTIDLQNIVEQRLSMAVLINQDKILLLKRKKSGKSFKGKWMAIMVRPVEVSEREETVIESVSEATGIEIEVSDIRIRGDEVLIRKGSILWRIHPFLIGVDQTDVKLGKEFEEYKWIDPSELSSFETFPGLGVIIESLLERKDPESKVC